MKTLDDLVKDQIKTKPELSFDHSDIERRIGFPAGTYEWSPDGTQLILGKNEKLRPSPESLKNLVLRDSSVAMRPATQAFPVTLPLVCQEGGRFRMGTRICFPSEEKP
jgi:hypothetical protein